MRLQHLLILSVLTGCADPYAYDPNTPYVNRVTAAMNNAEHDLSNCVVETGSRARYNALAGHLHLTSVSNQPPGMQDTSVPSSEELQLVIEWRASVQRCYAQLLSASDRNFKFATPILREAIDRINNSYNSITPDISSWNQINQYLDAARAGNQRQLAAIEVANRAYVELVHQQEIAWREDHPAKPIMIAGVPFSVTIAGHENGEFAEFMRRNPEFNVTFKPSNGRSSESITALSITRR